MLSPAVDAYGPFVVAVLIVFLLGAIIVGVIDYRRWTGHHRTAAKKRHPAGRAIAKGATAADAVETYGDAALDAAAAHYDARPGRHRAAPTPARGSFVRAMKSIIDHDPAVDPRPRWRHP